MAQKLEGGSPRSSQHTTSPSRFIGKHDCLEPNDVLHRALACPDNRRQAWGDRKVSSKTTLTAQGWCRRFRDSELTAAAGASHGRGRGNGTVVAMANSQVARREVKVARVLSRMANQHGGRQPHPFDLAPPNMRGHFLFLLLDRR